MTINDAITKLRVMLGAEMPVVEVNNEEIEDKKEEVTLASAELVDGTIVVTEGELAPGAILYIEVEEGEKPFAPQGQHETVDGLIVSVGENGEIISIEEKEAEAEPVAEAATDEEVVEEVMEEVAPVAETFNAEELLNGVAEIIKPYQEKIEELSNELNTLTERFNEVADLPAAAPIKRNFMEEAKAANEVAAARFDKLARMRKSQK